MSMKTCCGLIVIVGVFALCPGASAGTSVAISISNLGLLGANSSAGLSDAQRRNIDRMLARMDSTSGRFESRVDRLLSGALRQIDRLDRAGASLATIQRAADRAAFSIQLAGATLVADLDRIETAANGVIDQAERRGNPAELVGGTGLRVRVTTRPDGSSSGGSSGLEAARRDVADKVSDLTVNAELEVENALALIDAAVAAVTPAPVPEP
jgi:hypothetical protein